jgi:cytochrome c oxidase assembly protein subunit 15
MAVPERVRRSARILCGIEVLQAAIGYTQYFTHLPAALVEVHVLGATTLVVGAVQFLLAMSEHPKEPSASVGPSAPVQSRAELRPQSLEVGG